MRKFWIGLFFLASSTALAIVAVLHGTDLVGVATVIGAQSLGVGAIVWGNTKEHEAKAKNGNGV